MGNMIPNKKYENMVSEIMQEFDFYKCWIVMTHLEWEWFGRGVPAIETMKEMSRGHLKAVIDGLLDKNNKMKPQERYIVSSGGFTAWGYKNRYGNIERLGLEFIITEWDVERDSDY